MCVAGPFILLIPLYLRLELLWYCDATYIQSAGRRSPSQEFADDDVHRQEGGRAVDNIISHHDVVLIISCAKA